MANIVLKDISGNNIYPEVDNTTLSGTITENASGFVIGGDVYSSLGNKLDKSLSSNFYPMTGNPSGFISGYQDGYLISIDNNKLNFINNNCSAIKEHYSVAIGGSNLANGFYSVAMGSATTAFAKCSHSQGYNTCASASGSHAEGFGTLAYGENSHAEGIDTSAIGNGSHAEGYETSAVGWWSHAEGLATSAIGRHSFAAGNSTVANNDNQFVIGKLNDNKATNVFEIGGGSDTANRANLFEVTSGGDISAKRYFYDKDGRVGNYHKTSATVTNNGTNFTITLSSNNSYVVLDNSAVSGNQPLNITIVPPTLEQDELLDCIVQFKPKGGAATSGHNVSASGLTQVGVRAFNINGIDLNYIRPNEIAQVRLLGNTYSLM